MQHSAQQTFQKILNDKSEMSFNDVYFNQTRSLAEKIFALGLDKISGICV